MNEKKNSAAAARSIFTQPPSLLFYPEPEEVEDEDEEGVLVESGYRCPMSDQPVMIPKRIKKTHQTTANNNSNSLKLPLPASWIGRGGAGNRDERDEERTAEEE